MDVTDILPPGEHILALEVNGKLPSATARRSRPSGVTGAFYLEAIPQPQTSMELGPWQSRLAPELPGQVVTADQPVTFSYLETTLKIPETWAEGKLFLETDEKLGFLVINNQVVMTPTWMHRLDVSNLLALDKSNLIRWQPNGIPSASSPTTMKTVPTLKLTLIEEESTTSMTIK